jgi:hypothetical protein
MFQFLFTFNRRFSHRLNLAIAGIFLKFGNSAFYHLNPIGAYPLATITGKAAEFPMLSPKRTYFFSLSGRPSGQAATTEFFKLFNRFLFSQSPGIFPSDHDLSRSFRTIIFKDLSLIRRQRRWV